ncbi:hypothetical protein BKA67DRAFT_523916 [Truncatella angustata]|uniref:PH domain-containing protein n=1 Tax=Truncatella angustata TaxID=152316 RepID=A0A9P8UDP2_9PEZI|nr:uncharacterized protein BKA67DRAFT_523916 [Truncatella angustata]KAH6648023.1 hypothetical protein BKA67DRAFT_523916 [Truncatella angustata]KAH8196839.1 hypothetical protein TruAng_008980 [Truncatella angustata]
MSAATQEMPLRQGTTMSSITSNDAVPEMDPTTTAGLLSERLRAWKHAVAYLEDYVGAVEKVHHHHAKEYEKMLKTISQPLREGRHFDQGLGGVAGFFENMRVNTQALINSNAETGKTLKGTVLPVLERLHKEIKSKSSEIMHGAEKSAKEVDKSRNTTQKHIELLGQHTAAFESTGGKMNPADDPYVIQRGVLHRLNKQVIDENNHRNDLIQVQNSFQAFEAHVISVVQQAMEALNAVAGGQAEKTRALYADMVGAAQRIPPDFEWQGFLHREGASLVNPDESPRSVDAISFPNQNHNATKALIEGSLERKSRNKLSWGTHSAYYVVTPSKFLHEFKDDDNLHNDPKPELSIYLPDAVIGAPNGEKFNVKGKDRSKGIGAKLSGSSELSFKAHSPAEAQKWFEAIRVAAGASGPAYESTPNSPIVSNDASPSFEKTESAALKQQEAGVAGAGSELSPATRTNTLETTPTATSTGATTEPKTTV